MVGSGGISTAELMEKAKAQGMNVTGFGGGAPQQGFGQGFAPSMANPVVSPMGQPAAAFPGDGVPKQGLAPPPVQPPSTGQGGFAPPSGFNVPTGFPPRS